MLGPQLKHNMSNPNHSKSMKRHHRVVLLGSLSLLAGSGHAQVSLTGAGYLETFDSLGSGLPPGWSVHTGATATAAGSSAAFSGGAYPWSGTGGGFHNYTSTDGLGSGTSTALQAAAGDRALGVRQTSSVGDPGAAFVLQVANTLGYQDFSLAFSFHLVDEEAREGTWTVDYAMGSSPASFTALGTVSRNVWGSQSESLALPADVNNQAQPLWIRLAGLTPSTGAGSRDSVAIDDVQLAYRTFTVVPEPSAGALVVGAGLLGLVGWRRACQRR